MGLPLNFSVKLHIQNGLIHQGFESSRPRCNSLQRTGVQNHNMEIA